MIKCCGEIILWDLIVHCLFVSSTALFSIPPFLFLLSIGDRFLQERKVILVLLFQKSGTKRNI